MPNLASSHHERLRDFLQKSGVTCVEIREHRASDLDFMLYVSGGCVSTRAGHGRTSVPQMDRLRADIKQRLALSVEWVITGTKDDRVASLESALLSALKTRFHGVFATVFVSPLQKSPALVWVDAVPHVKPRPSEEELNKVAASIFSAFGLERPTVRYIDNPEVPSNLMILRGLKARSPATIEVLAEWLRQRDALMPDLKWLQRKLDTLRRKRLIVYSRRDGTYAMAEEGLRIVPHTLSRSSSDVERALALSRRKW